jgi:hypothetical protein
MLIGSSAEDLIFRLNPEWRVPAVPQIWASERSRKTLQFLPVQESSGESLVHSLAYPELAIVAASTPRWP